MDIKQLFTRQLNYRLVNQPIDLARFEKLTQPPTDAKILFEGRGVQVLRMALPTLNSDIEKKCIQAVRKAYPDAVYLFADRAADDEQTRYHLCNGAGKQLPLTPDKQRLFATKIAYFEVTDDVTGTLDLQERIAKAYETEKLTRPFYKEFEKYRTMLLKFMRGIPLDENKSWYASVLINRLMFIYFVQKHGLIGGRNDFLWEEFEISDEKGENYFQDFLLPLFFRGFATKAGPERGQFDKRFSGVPYLNGGLFAQHKLEAEVEVEAKHETIEIPNKVFRELLSYFNKYRWYLDERPLHDEDELNPDVLGYIFEKYINQKQMGAYYTKEDITGYICRNTILPFLLSKVLGEAGLSALLPINGTNIERYIYDAVKTEEYLPTESEREYKARRQRFANIMQDAASGAIAQVNDLITYNLDIATYADDAIAAMDAPTLQQFYFDGLKPLTVLDPTCGSGAFLFAALNILLPLYKQALLRMDHLSQEDEVVIAQRAAIEAFQEEEARITKHANREYFVIKTIIVNNLYGVDIMEEATEICKLRLFLRLAYEINDPKHIEPLPDIDFNIKAGNTLVGFATREEVKRALTTQQKVNKRGEIAEQSKLDFVETRDVLVDIEEQLQAAEKAFKVYQVWNLDGTALNVLPKQKEALQKTLRGLTDTLDRALAQEYGLTPPEIKDSRKLSKPSKAENEFAAWKSSHQPFHWFAEFYGILQRGGFDVIVGNPPYVEYRLVQSKYTLRGFRSELCGNLYGFVMERATILQHRKSQFGMIVPTGLMGLDDALPLRRILLDSMPTACFSSYAIRPSKLFDGVDQRLCIYLGRNEQTSHSLFTTKYQHWSVEERDNLFSLLSYCKSQVNSRLQRVPQLGEKHAQSILKKLETSSNRCIADYYTINQTKHCLIHYHRSPRYWIRAMDFEQYFKSPTRSKSIHHFRDLWFRDVKAGKAIGAIINSSLFFWWFVSIGNGRNITSTDVERFPIGDVYSSDLYPLAKLFDKLMKDYQENSFVRERIDCEFQEFKPSISKPIIDEIDRVLAKHYGFNDEELDFIINYDIKYRMGKGSEEETPDE